MPSLGIALRPGGCVGKCAIPTQGTAPVQTSFRWMAACIDWRFGFGQSSSRHIPRVPQRAAPYAWARPLLSWHALVPQDPFEPEVSHQTQEPPSEFLPAELGI